MVGGQGPEGGGMGSYYLMGTEHWFYEIKRVLEMDGANGRTAIGMYVHLKMVKVVNYILCIFYHIKIF